MTKGILLIAAKLKEYGDFVLSDLELYDKGQLKKAAAALLLDNHVQRMGNIPEKWNSHSWYRLCNFKNQERIVLSGAFLAAEIDRLNMFK